MTRTLLLGRAGAGKTHACLHRLTEALRAGKRALLLVPTYGQAEHLRHLLLDEAGGLSARTVETLTSLAERVARQRLRDLVPVPVRDRVAAGVLDEHFPEAARLAGFRAEFLAAVKELKEQGTEVAVVVERARAHFGERSRGRRLFLAYAAYVEALPGPDHEDLLLKTRDHLRAEPVSLDLFLVDGFHDFTNVQREICELLAEHAQETLLTLPDHPVSAVTRGHFDAYATDTLDDNHRASGALAHLERRLFRAPSQKAAPDGLEVIACASEEDEADRLARMVKSSNRPFRDFLIVRRSFAGLHDLYRAAFRRHGIPLRFFGREPLGRTPAARALTLWLRRDKLSCAELLPLLRSPYLLDRPPLAEVERLARNLREHGEPRDLDEFEHIASTLERDGAMPFGVRDALVAVPEGDEETARAGRFFDEMRKEIAACDDPEHLLRRIPMIQGAVRDRRHDCVYAVDASDARQWEKPVVMVAGLTADAFPRQVRQDIFLRDQERRELSEQRGLHLPLRSRKEEEERYLFYVAVTRASERLVLTHAAFDEKGTPRPPSPYLLDALEHFEGLETRRVPLSEQFVQPRDAVSRGDLLAIVADGLQHATPLGLALYEQQAVPRSELAWPRRLELLRARPIRNLPEPRPFSATSLNAYLRCPFLFLVRHTLGLRPRREPALDPLLRGIIIHDVLQRYTEQGGDIDALFDETFEEQTHGLRLGLEGAHQRRWMRLVVERAAEGLEGKQVECTELAFEIEVDGVPLRGRIDRVDLCGGGRLVRDYKTGQVDLKQAMAFRDLQLDSYLLAVDNPVGALYDRLGKGDEAGFVLKGVPVTGRNVEQLTEEQFAKRRLETRRIIREVAGAVRAGKLAVKPRDPETCQRTRCDGYDLCRVARARWLAKRARP